MPLACAGKAERLAGEPLAPGPQRHRGARALRPRPLAWRRLGRSARPGGRPPRSGVRAPEAQRLALPCARPTPWGLPRATTSRQPRAPLVSKRLPPPARGGRLLPLGPPLLACGFRAPLEPPSPSVGTPCGAEWLRPRGEPRFCFFQVFRTVGGLSGNTRAGSRLPLPLRRMATSGSVSAGARPVEKRSRGPRSCGQVGCWP